MNARNAGDVRLGADGFNHLLCWTTSPIPPTERHEQFGVDVFLAIMLPGCFHIIRVCQPVVVVMILDRFTGSGKERGQHLRSVHPTPMKGVIWKTTETAPMNR